MFSMDLDELIQRGRVSRIFRAQRKVTVPDVVSHLTQRAAGKEPLFVEDVDYLYMLASMKEITRKRSLEVYAFCLMPTHVHILLSPRADGLHECMRDLFSRYAMMFNRKYERKGHLFAGPYRQALCLDDGYLLAASLYIHANPGRAGLVADSADYRWSSVKLFIDHDAPGSFVKPAFILRLLGGDDRERKTTYSGLLAKSASLAADNALEQTDAVKGFRKMLAQAFPAVFSCVGKKKQIAKRTGLELLDEEELQKRIAGMRTKTGRISPETRKAWQFVIEQLIARGYKREEIAAILGLSVKTVYNIRRGTSESLYRVQP
jgi:putative transposase